MKRFKDAYQYLHNTDEKSIAKRIAIIGAFFNYGNINFGHDYIVDMAAALYGPFDLNITEDSDLMAMLNHINFGFDAKWKQKLYEWVYDYTSDECERSAFRSMDELLSSGKGDRILEEFNYIVKVVRPSEFTYFPELFGGNPDNAWPRI